MTTLHLGVNDIPYADKGSGGNTGLTTGDVAGFLEARYHVMEVFYTLHADDIAEDLAVSFANALEASMSGAPLTIDPWGAATSKIVTRFNQAIDMKEFDHVMPGVPTQASLDGTSARFKRPYSKYKNRKTKKRRGARPSFQFSGLYEDSMTAWID